MRHLRSTTLAPVKLISSLNQSQYLSINYSVFLDEEEKKKDGGESTPRWKAVCVMNNSSDPVSCQSALISMKIIEYT